MQTSPAIVFFDGECNLCNGFVRFILDRDATGRFRFASLQSPFAREFFREHGWDPQGIDSVVLFRDGTFLVHSDAALAILAGLPGVWSLGRHFERVPVAWRDRAYRWLAARRYRLFGRREACRLPTGEEAVRFLS